MTIPVPGAVSVSVRIWWLWTRCSAPFRWAHKPLCRRFRHDVLRVGPFYVCRSCLFLYTGLLVVGGLGLISSHADRLFGLPAFLALLAPTLAGSIPRLYASLHRRSRDLLRFASGALIAMAAGMILRGQWAVGAACGLALAAFWQIYFRQRRARKRRECDGCPELDGKSVCSGYAFQANRIRAFERAATDCVNRFGPPPSVRPHEVPSNCGCRDLPLTEGRANPAVTATNATNPFPHRTRSSDSTGR